MGDKQTAKAKEKEVIQEVLKTFSIEDFVSPNFNNYVHGKFTGSIKDWIKHGKAFLDNEAQEQDIKLKKYTLVALFVFLVIETFCVFLFAWWQATSRHQFHLEEWSFKLLLGATILQISYMARTAVKHLFPEQK